MTEIIGKNAVRVYIKPFTETGVYSSTWNEVTKYVSSIGQITQDVDSQDYQLGMFKNSSVSIKFNNRSGYFSDVNVFNSLFKYKRNDSQVKITWSLLESAPQCGIAELGNTFLSEEIEIYKGLLSDESAKLDAKQEDITFQVLGLESLFNRAVVPFASLSIGNSIAEAIYTCLNQSIITGLLTVSVANINPDTDQDLDAITNLENKTVKEALDSLLLVSNSVLYIKSDVVYVTSRDPSADNKYTFYGQASQSGPENIVDIKNFNNGMQRVFNYFYWKDSSDQSTDTDSINLLGARKKEIDFESFTNSTKRTTLMTALVAEFKDKKIEMDLDCYINYKTIALNLLDKVNIDYPTVYNPSTGFDIPICGRAICGDPETATLPMGLWSMTIDSTKYFKILKRTYDINKMSMSLKLREI